MRPRDRQIQITDLVRTRGRVTVDELTQDFSISAETVRRDLTLLATTGKIQKIHGGAVPMRDFGEGAFAQRIQQNAAAKRSIARQAHRLVSPGDTLFIDTGSTTLAMAEELSTIDDLTIVTNSTAIARVVSSANESTRVYLLGGEYSEDNRQTCGAMAISQLNGFHGDLSIITVGAVSAGVGVMDYNAAEAEIAASMIDRSDRAVILADASKFDRVAPFVVASFDGIDNLVCDSAPTVALAASLEQAGVKVDF